MSNSQKPLGNENSYTKDFWQSLHEKLNLTDRHTQNRLEKTILLATQAYMRNYNENQKQLSAHEIKTEIIKAINHIDKASQSLINVYASGNYGEEITNNLYAVISKKYPLLSDTLPHLKNNIKTSPIQSLEFLGALADGLNSTLENAESPDKTIKSIALYHWIMILSAQLEPIIGHKLEQSHYYNGQYVSKKEINDSELLLFIIHPLNSNITISQMETAIKDTRKERHEAPWNDYFPF